MTFDPIFPMFEKIWQCDVLKGQNVKNIRKMTSLLDSPSKSWFKCKILTFQLEYKTRNNNFFYLFFSKLGRGGYDVMHLLLCDCVITCHFQNFYHHFLTTPGHVLTCSRVRTFAPCRVYGISDQLLDWTKGINLYSNL